MQRSADEDGEQELCRLPALIAARCMTRAVCICCKAGVDLVQLQAFDLLRRRFQRTPALATQLMEWVCPRDIGDWALSGGSQAGDVRASARPLHDNRHADLPIACSKTAPRCES